MRKYLVGLAILLLSNTAMAVYNANMAGVLTEVILYTDGDYIYMRLNNQPTSHPSCNPAYFVIQDVELSRRQMLLSRALTAYASKESVNIGYDSSGNCADGYIRVHRVG